MICKQIMWLYFDLNNIFIKTILKIRRIREIRKDKFPDSKI